MTSTFVPLNAANLQAARLPLAAPAPAPVEPISARDFRPLAAAHANTACDRSAAEPKVTVIREGDRVTRIIVECSCGQSLELSCTY